MYVRPKLKFVSFLFCLFFVQLSLSGKGGPPSPLTDSPFPKAVRHSARMRAGSSPTSTHFQSAPKVVEIDEIC